MDRYDGVLLEMLIMVDVVPLVLMLVLLLILEVIVDVDVVIMALVLFLIMLSPRSSAASSKSWGVLIPGVISYRPRLEESCPSSFSENISLGRTGTGNSAPVSILSAVTYLGVSGCDALKSSCSSLLNGSPPCFGRDPLCLFRGLKPCDDVDDVIDDEDES